METASGKPGEFTFEGREDGRDYNALDQFWACPDGEEDPIDVYRIFVADERLGKRCFGIAIATRNFTGPEEAAWGF